MAAAVVGESHRDPHSGAVALLLYGKSAEAVRALESLVAAEPKNVSYWSDLSAARLEHGAISNDARLLALGLAASDHALSLQPVNPEASFNRALALEALGLRFAAADAWRHYLEIDPTSQWTIEARERMREAARPTRDSEWKTSELELAGACERGDAAAVERIVRAFPQDARASGEVTYLPQWANAVVAGDLTAARRSLTTARHIGMALLKVNGEGLLAESVAVIDRAGDDIDVIARAYVVYARARQNNRDRKVAESIPRFLAAERGFAASRHPMEHVAAYYRANALVDHGDSTGAAALASTFAARMKGSYRSLHAYVLWLGARLLTGEGRHYETFVTVTRARKIFEQLGENDNATRLRVAEAAMLARLGRDREAWEASHIAIRNAAESGKWSLVETAIDAIAREEIDGPAPEIARALLNVQVSVPSALPLTRFNGLMWRAFLDARNNGRPLDTTAVRDAAMRIPDAKQRADAIDELRLAEALAIEDHAPAAAEVLFDQVIDYRTRNHLWSHLPTIHLHRGRIRRAMSRVDGAAEDFSRAIDLTETRRETIRNDTLRDAFLGHSAQAYNDLADLLVEHGEWEQAFEVTERTRARILVDQADRRPVRLAELVAAVPRDVVAIHYTTFATRTLIVILKTGEARHVLVPVGRAEISSLRDKFANAISLANTDAAGLSRALYQSLIDPIRSRINPGNLLIIIPDDTTYGIPFAALQGASGRFLADDNPIGVAPTAAAIPTEMRELPLQLSQVTIVADPAISAELFPNLQRLPAARRDARTIIVHFERADTLVGENATRSAFMDAAPMSDVIHVGAHALSSTRDASLSLLALAAKGDDPGVLYLRDVQALRLPRQPLVVLAGCQTGSLGGGKGAIRSLANAFLSAGSRSVLATLWNVNDDAASAITADFYRGLSRGSTPPVALRDAQLHAMRSRPTRDWASFQLHLGVTGHQEKLTRVTLTQ